MNSSLSTIETKCMTETKRWGISSRKMIQPSKRLSRKILSSASNTPPNTDSTPEYEAIHRNSTKLVTSRKSFVKKRSAILKKKALQNKAQKEKRFAVYNQRRRMSEVELTVDETYSIDGRANISTATYDIEGDDGSYESDIRGFQKEMNECQGPIEIVTDHFDDEIDFEKLCNVKQSECPFKDEVKLGQTVVLPRSSKDLKSASDLNFEQNCLNSSPQSINLNASGTRMSSHCGRLYWNQQKIPTIEKFRAEKKSFENDSGHSSASSNHSTQPLLTTLRSFQSNVATAVHWHSIPTFYKYYMIAITIVFISMVYYQLSQWL